MYCASCGTENTENNTFCSNCGASLTPAVEAEPVAAPVAPETPVYTAQVEQQPAKKDGMGIASLVLGILGLLGNTVCNCLCGCIGGAPSFIMSIIGLVLGIMSNNKAKAAGTKNQLAFVGMILSVVALVLFFIVLIFNAIFGAAIFSEMGYDMNDIFDF